MAFGRPTEYRKEMCDTVIEVMTEGGSITEVAATIGTCKSTLYEWANPESKYYKEDFSNAVKQGRQLAQTWWGEAGTPCNLWEDRRF